LPRDVQENYMASDMQAESALSSQLETLLARCGTRDRTNIEKPLAALDAEPDPTHAKLWRKFVAMLAALAPMPVTTVGTQALMFFIADGKFRMQVFALEDKGEGRLGVYMPDVLDQAVKAKILFKSGENYLFGDASDRRPINVQSMDASNMSDPPAYVKNLIGWNRKAIKLSPSALLIDTPELGAAAALTALAAKQWAAAQAK